MNGTTGNDTILIRTYTASGIPSNSVNSISFGFNTGQDFIDLDDPAIIATSNFEKIALTFQEWLRPDNLEFSLTSSGDLLFNIISSSGTLTFSHRLELSAENLQIEFDNDVTVDVNTLIQNATEEPISVATVVQINREDGTANNDDIVGTDDVNVINAGEGNDTITGGQRSDELNGGDGDDVIYGGAGNDKITGGLGSDTIYGGDGDDFITPGVELFSPRQESINPVNLNSINRIDGGFGNDTINIDDFDASTRSENQILFGRGDGNDLVDFNEYSLGPEELDKISLIFKSGLSPEDIELDISPSQQPNAEQEDFVFRIIDTGETLTLDADFYVFLGDATITFEDGGFIDIGALDISIIEERTAGNQSINLSSLLVTDVVNSIQGTENADNLLGTIGNDVFHSGGLSNGVESIRSNGGSDTLVLDGDDAHAENSANNSNAHFRVRDFVIDDVAENSEADILDIGNFLLGSNLDASNIGNYLHVVSGTFGYNRSSIFVDREGQFTDQDRANLTNGGSTGGNGSDLFLEFQGQAGNNNLEVLTGFSDNTVEQFQALIDLGFLDLSNANSEAVERPIIDESVPISIQGSEHADRLIGTANDNIFFSGGLSSGVESISGNGGSDILVLDADDAVATDIADNGNAHFRIRDFVIDNVATNSEADILDISDLISGFGITADNLGNHLHIVSGTFGHNRSSIFINRDGEFSDADRAALTADASAGGQGADLFLEFQGHAANNNLADITGFADNTAEQLQALIDMGFLKPGGLVSELTVTSTGYFPDVGIPLIETDPIVDPSPFVPGPIVLNPLPPGLVIDPPVIIDPPMQEIDPIITNPGEPFPIVDDPFLPEDPREGIDPDPTLPPPSDPILIEPELILLDPIIPIIEFG
jgi:hypothetical protein